MAMSITGRIWRIEAAWLRVPLWSLFWPLAVLDCCTGALTSGNARRLLVGRFWTFQIDMLVLGIDGLTKERQA